MNYYELTFILDAQLAPEKQEEVITKYLDLLKSKEVEILNVEKWGKKKLAYVIEDRQYGYYMMTQFRAPTSFIPEVEHFLKVTPSIFRYLILHRTPKMLKLIQHETERLAREASRIAERERTTALGLEQEAIGLIEDIPLEVTAFPEQNDIPEGGDENLGLTQKE
jgi:small subunit ribosomal protein S6